MIQFQVNLKPGESWNSHKNIVIQNNGRTLVKLKVEVSGDTVIYQLEQCQTLSPEPEIQTVNS